MIQSVSVDSTLGHFLATLLHSLVSKLLNPHNFSLTYLSLNTTKSLMGVENPKN